MADDSQVYNTPFLVSDDVTVHYETHTVPVVEWCGPLKVLKTKSFIVESKPTAICKGLKMGFTIMDVGETASGAMGPETKKCGICTTAAVYRHAAGASDIIDGTRAAAQHAMTCLSNDSLNAAEDMAIALAGEGLSADEAMLEEDIIFQHLATSQPTSPAESRMLAQDCTLDYSEVKLFFDCNTRQVEGQLIVPMQAWDGQAFKDRPVVSRFIEGRHDYAARCDFIEYDGVKHEYKESMTTLETASWKGVWLQQIQSMFNDLKVTMPFTMYTSNTIAQHLERQRVDMPPWVVQFGLRQQCGAVGVEVGNCTEAVGGGSYKFFSALHQPKKSTVASDDCTAHFKSVMKQFKTDVGTVKQLIQECDEVSQELMGKIEKKWRTLQKNEEWEDPAAQESWCDGCAEENKTSVATLKGEETKVMNTSAETWPMPSKWHRVNAMQMKWNDVGDRMANRVCLDSSLLRLIRALGWYRRNVNDF